MTTANFTYKATRLATLAIMTALVFGFSAMANAQSTQSRASDHAFGSVQRLQVNSSGALEAAITAMEQGNFERAVRLNQRALRANLNGAQKVIAYNNLCISLHMEGDLEAATDACTNAIEIDHTYWQAYNNRANVAFDAADYRAAERDYDKALSLKPGEEAVRANLRLVRQLTASAN